MGTGAQLLISRFLDVNGDGTGDKNARGDYSVTPEEFYFECPEGQRAAIARLIISASDTAGMQTSDYGNITGGLTNGYTILVKDSAGNTIIDLTDTWPIQTNGMLTRYCYDVAIREWGSGDEFLGARWTFAKSGIPLFLEPGDRFSITFSDDLQGLLTHHFMLQGYWH